MSRTSDIGHAQLFHRFHFLMNLSPNHKYPFPHGQRSDPLQEGMTPTFMQATMHFDLRRIRPVLQVTGCGDGIDDGDGFSAPSTLTNGMHMLTRKFHCRLHSRVSSLVASYSAQREKE
ncbi:hypothetical protein ACRALDRAFT_212710 [Sodiomyces alcalophilus JCM 7366]|uniref:uncharacterized protein n=1 Tax=Sodiomyces alcalophilus JCM 7366 TaxID=591952 RepID=UPI0039B51A63